MKLAYQQLDAHLHKTLAPIYLISGDEILLVQEALDQVRVAARAAGFSERISLTVEPNSDWEKLLYAEIHNISLFAPRRIIEVHLAATKPNAAASKILQEIAARTLTDTILLISMHKLDARAEQTTWYKALDKHGVAIPVWPITIEQLTPWIMQRAKKIGLSILPDAAKLLAEQVEGNLLAAGQEVEKLALLQTTGVIDINTIEEAVTDNARFDIFNLVECALSGDSKRCVRILDNLQAEGIEPILVLWALARELRTMADLSRQSQGGASLAPLFSKYRIWEKRQAGVRQFLRKHTTPSCWDLLSKCSRIDQIVKGGAAGNVWSELQQLALKMAGNVIIN